MKDDRLYLIFITECLARIEKYTAPGKDAFMESDLVQDAVLRNLHTLTESTQRLSEPLRRRYFDVPWQEIAGFRNVLVHDYLGIDLERIWAIIEHDLPSFKFQIHSILKDVGE